MAINRMLLLKVILWGVVLYHVFLGVAANVLTPGPAADAVISLSYGASFDITPITQHILRILGAFMLLVAVVALFAALDPVRYQGVIYGLIVLFLIRVVQRLVFAGDIVNNLHVGTDRLVIQSIFFVLLSAALFLLRPTGSRAVA